MIQKRAGGVELPWGESDYDQKCTSKKKVYFCIVAFHQHQEQTPRKIKWEEEKQEEKEKPDYLHILKEMQNFISFLDKVKVEWYFALIQYVGVSETMVNSTT